MIRHRILDRGAWVFLVILGIVTVMVPVLNLAFPPESALHVPTYLVALFGKYVCYALLALSIDLIWGYAGILSLGHGAFFALGGYAMGMYLMRQIGARGVYGNPVLPDFMVFLSYTELPWFWHGFDMFWFACLMVLFVPGLLAFVFGYSLSALPLVRAGIALGSALSLVLAADTLSIFTMEVVDNAVMWLVPGAMNAHFDDWLYWATMGVAFLIAFAAAYPVNRHLLKRGKGHAVTHHALGDDHQMDNRPLAYALVAFLLGGLVASLGGLS